MPQNKIVSNSAHTWIDDPAPLCWIERNRTMGGIRIATARGPVYEMIAGSDAAREQDAKIIRDSINSHRVMVETLRRSWVGATTQLEDLEASHKDRPRDGDADLRAYLEKVIAESETALRAAGENI